MRLPPPTPCLQLENYAIAEGTGSLHWASLAQPAPLPTSLHWGRWQGLQGDVPESQPLSLHGKECVMLVSSFSPEPVPSTPWAGGQGLLWAQPWPSVTLSRACPHSPLPCPRAGWARTCLGSTSFASNPGLALCRPCPALLRPAFLSHGPRVQVAHGDHGSVGCQSGCSARNQA